MNENELTKAIVNAYQFAHTHCKYGPVDVHYPPGESGQIDCVGLIFRAFYTLGAFPKMVSIDDVTTLCESVGMVRTINIEDVYKHTCVVCFQHTHNKGTNHVNHVYYSLGGKSLTNIDKFDLGSDARIQAQQPFKNVAVNEWIGKMDFLCAYYFDTCQYPPCNELELKCGRTGFITANTSVYCGAGTKWKKLKNVKKGTRCIVYPMLVTSPLGNDFRVIQTFDGLTGFILDRAVTCDLLTYYEGRVTGTDGTLNVRAGVGMDKPIMGIAKEGELVDVNTLVFDVGGTLWANITTADRISGFSAACHIART